MWSCLPWEKNTRHVFLRPPIGTELFFTVLHTTLRRARNMTRVNVIPTSTAIRADMTHVCAKLMHIDRTSPACGGTGAVSLSVTDRCALWRAWQEGKMTRSILRVQPSQTELGLSGVRIHSPLYITHMYLYWNWCNQIYLPACRSCALVRWAWQAKITFHDRSDRRQCQRKDHRM